MPDYTVSQNGERFDGKFATLEEAIAEGEEYGRPFWVGEAIPPKKAELYFSQNDVDDFLEQVSEQDDYCGEWAEYWDSSTEAQREQLAEAIRSVMADWFEKNDLRPQFFCVTNIKEYK